MASRSTCSSVAPVARQLADGAALGHHHDAVGERQHLGQVGRDDEQRHAARRRGRAAAGRSRSARRRRRRASARRRSAASAPSPATWRAAPSAGCRPRDCRRSGARSASRCEARRRSAWPAPRPWRWRNWPPDETLRQHRRRRCCRRCPCRGTGRTALRSSGTMPMPACLPSHGPVGAIVAGRRRGCVPRRRRRAPKIASQNSLRPEPIRPARQTISPARTVIEAERTRGGAATSSASSTTSPGCAPAGAAPDAPRARPSAGSARPVEVSATVAGAGEPAVLQHRDRVAEREDLGQPVRDVDRPTPRRAPAAAPRRTASPSRSASAPRSARRGSAAAGRATAPWRSRRSAPAPATARRPCAPGSIATPSCAISAVGRVAHLAHVDLAEPARRLPAGEDILGDRQLRHQRAFLVHDADAELAGGLLVEVAELDAVEPHAPWSRA